MAQVKLDMTEYDSMKNTIQDKETRIKELKEELQKTNADLQLARNACRDNTKTIIKTKYKARYFQVDYKRISRNILKRLVYYIPPSSYGFSNISNDIENIVEQSTQGCEYHEFDDAGAEWFGQDEYVNFESVRRDVEKRFEKETKEAIEKLNKEKQSYEKKKEALREEVKKSVYEELTGKVELLEYEKSELKEKIVKLENENVSLYRKLEKSEQESDKLKKKYESKQTKKWYQFWK